MHTMTILPNGRIAGVLTLSCNNKIIKKNEKNDLRIFNIHGINGMWTNEHN